MLWLLGALGALAVGSAVSDLGAQDDEPEQDDGGSDDFASRAPIPGAKLLDELPGPSHTDIESDAIAKPDKGVIGEGAEYLPDDTVDPADDDYDLVTGTDGSDTLIADQNAAFLTGRGGDDLLIGAGGDDHISGGLGEDTALGGAGDDTIRGEGGDDSLTGDTGDDEIYGAEGADTLAGGAGNDSLAGGDGDDYLMGEAGDDTLHGLQGDDILSGGAGEDAVFGGRGDDTLSGVEASDDAARDFLNGGEGNDHLIAGAKDVVSTGTGADTVVLDFFDGGNEPVFITDFTADEDTLVISYEDTDETPPDLKIEPDEEDEAFFRVLLDDVLVAEVLSDAPLLPGHVSLQPVAGA